MGETKYKHDFSYRINYNLQTRKKKKQNKKLTNNLYQNIVFLILNKHEF